MSVWTRDENGKVTELEPSRDVEPYRGSQPRMNAKQATFKMLGNLEDGEQFTGMGLSRTVNMLCGDVHFPATTLRYMREYRAVSGRGIECINKARSVYEIKAEGEK